MSRIPSLMLVACIFAGCVREQDPNPGFDFSTIDLFWDIQSTLASDSEPSPEDWETLFNTPGYQALTESEFTQEFFRSNFELAYMPSRASERDEALQGSHGSYLRHYLQVASQREELDQQLAWLRETSVIPDVIQRTSTFLSPDELTGSPDVAFVIFANDARAYDPIVIDLLASRDWDFQTFLAHEFHHWYRDRVLVVDVDAVDSLDHDLVWTLNQIHAEGLADQIDKRSWIMGESEPPGGLTGYAGRYLENLGNTRTLLHDLDSLMVRYAAALENRREIGAEIRRMVPQSGHPTGFFMASLIMDQLGVEALIAEVGNPFAFVRAFNSAANQAGEAELLFSSTSIDLLDSLERQYSIH